MLLVATLLLAAILMSPAPTASGAITVRTENYPRPPYSGATYYIYERAGAPICTKLEVCNKFENCTVTYRQGAFKDPEDQETGAPYGTTPAVIIPAARVAKHVCLTRYRLNNSRP